MIRAAFAALLLTASTAAAEPLDTAAKFEAYVRARTIFFHLGEGQIYASERYMADRRVRWSLLEGACQEGEWWAQDGLICFAYEGNANAQCWKVDLTPEGMRATSDDAINPLVIYEAQGVTGDQTCTGPRVGV